MILRVHETLKSLLQDCSSKASVLGHAAFFMVQLSHSYMTTGKTIALTMWTFAGKVMSLLFNALSPYFHFFLLFIYHLLLHGIIHSSIFLLFVSLTRTKAPKSPIRTGISGT